MDIDFDDLEAPSASKPAKFAPKNSKFKPALKPKPEPDAPSKSEPKPVPVVPKVEMDHPAPSPSPAPAPAPANGSVKNDNDVVNMDIDDAAAADDADDDDGEDKVVREIDVFFTKSDDANSKLYVMQYPLRPCWRPYELDERCSEVRVKPKSAEVEIDMSIQAESENFDTDLDDDKAMRKQVLSTAWRPPAANGYAVGILIRNELHLKPVDAVVQLRPSMQHLKCQNALDEEVIKREKSSKQVKKQGKPPAAVSEQSTDAEEEEQWIPLKYHGETSPLSYQYIEKMVARHDSHIQFPMDQSDYIDSLCPATSGKPRPIGSSRSALLKLPLEERFKKHLVEGPSANRFAAIKHLAPDASDEDIFKVLKEHAHLIQGWWVAKTKVKKGEKAVGRDVLLRDYAMLQFSKNPIFHETQLPRQTVLSEHMKTVLDEFAARRESFRDWKFRECPDVSFIKNYPEIVKDQKEHWDRVGPSIMETLFKNTKSSIGDKRPSASNRTSVVAPRTTNAPPSTPVMQDETREALPKAIQKLFQTYKVCSINRIPQRLREMAVSGSTQRRDTWEAKAAAAAAAAPLDEIQKVLTQVAVNIHGSFVLRSSPEYPQYDDLRKVVLDLFLADKPGGKLKKANIYAAARVQLKREITNIEYQKVLNELCLSQHSGWVLKTGDSPTT